MKKGKVFILSGPSGSGKTTLYKKLLASKKLRNNLVRSVSATTRSRRKGEKNGQDYLFISPKMFHFKKRQGHFLESENVFGNYYGTPRKNVEDLLKQGKNVLLCIDVKGAKAVCKKHPAAVTIFIKTVSLAVLAARLKSRGSDEAHVIKKRLKIAKEELKEEKEYQFVVINDHLSAAYAKLESIILAEMNA